ncbi:3-hydroxy-3-methylglutaryl-CoA reductase, partial [Limosilactobacillus mucosae]|nr:3-hydroxy-3-methylglutaryl-CoA reductase [Limosilactobacillus mucosae]
MKNNDNNNDNSDWMHGLYRLSDAQRRQIISDRFKLNDDKRELLACNASQLGNQLIENYLTDYRLPEGLVTNLVVNDKTYAVPVVTEEPSVVAAACNGAQRVALS